MKPQQTWRTSTGARTPEELETLFEDALILRDCETLAELFGEGATLIVDSRVPAQGREDIQRLALATWNDERPYVAAPRRVLQARDIALILTETTVSVTRRGGDGSWRYAIVHVSDNALIRKE